MTATGFYFDGASWTHKTNPYDQARWTTAMAWCKKSENLALKCTTNWNFSDPTQPNWILFPSGEKKNWIYKRWTWTEHNTRKVSSVFWPCKRDNVQLLSSKYENNNIIEAMDVRMNMIMKKKGQRQRYRLYLSVSVYKAQTF